MKSYLDLGLTLYIHEHVAQWILGDSSNKKQVLVDLEALDVEVDDVDDGLGLMVP